MPEFILDTGGCEQFATLDDFTQGYIEAMFFTETGTGDDEELEHATVAEFAPGELVRIAADCTEFQYDNAPELEQAYSVPLYDAEAAGRDYWYSRNGHGVGYWDRDLGDVGDALHAACQNDGRYLYRGDDELLYLG
jgi:hypothetical protein